MILLSGGGEAWLFRMRAEVFWLLLLGFSKEGETIPEDYPSPTVETFRHAKLYLGYFHSDPRC